MRSVPGEEKSAWSSWFKIGLFGSCLKVVSRLAQNCPLIVSKLAQRYLKVFVVVVIDVVVVALDYNYIRWKSKRVPTLSDFTA